MDHVNAAFDREQLEAVVSQSLGGTTEDPAKLITEFWQASEERLFSQKIVALVRDCSESLLERDRWLGRGIPYRKIGRRCLYCKADVVRWLEQHQLVISTSEYRDRAVA